VAIACPSSMRGPPPYPFAVLSQQAHQLATAQTSEVCETSEVSGQLAEVEAQVDEAAAQLWGITEAELQEIRRSLAELG